MHTVQAQRKEVSIRNPFLFIYSVKWCLSSHAPFGWPLQWPVTRKCAGPVGDVSTTVVAHFYWVPLHSWPLTFFFVSGNQTSTLKNKIVIETWKQPNSIKDAQNQVILFFLLERTVNGGGWDRVVCCSVGRVRLGLNRCIFVCVFLTVWSRGRVVQMICHYCM